MRTYCIAQGTLLNALWWPNWEGNPRKRGYTYTCDYSLCCIEETNTTFESNYNPIRGFPGSSASREFACKAGDPSLIPGLGRHPGEGTGYPLQYSWAFLVAQLVKKPPAVQETWVWSLGWKNLLKKGKAAHFSPLVHGESHGLYRAGLDWVTFTFTYLYDTLWGFRR